MYYGNWTCWNDVARDFSIDSNFMGNIFVLFAAYDTPDYEGYATVVFINEGKFHIVEGSHCSCFGLEDQWLPDEMPFEALLRMAKEGFGMLNQYGPEFENALRIVRDLGLDEIDPEEATVALKLTFG